jgi:hypothetical protein
MPHIEVRETRMGSGTLFPEERLLWAAEACYNQYRAIVGRSSLPSFQAADEPTRERFVRFALAVLRADEMWRQAHQGDDQ